MIARDRERVNDGSRQRIETRALLFLNAVEDSGEDLETAMQFLLSFWGRHDVTAICTFSKIKCALLLLYFVSAELVAHGGQELVDERI
jgi:hypothetical protein